MTNISIFDGTRLLETKECRLTVLPNGCKGAVWRGLAYPLSPSGSAIDVSGEAYPPGLCRHEDARASATASYAVAEASEEEAYLLIVGSVIACESAAAALREAGCDVLRSGRYFGEPVDGVEADWFVRFVKPAGEDGPLRERIGRILRTPSVVDASRPKADLRVQALATELRAARERQARDQEEIARLRRALGETTMSAAEREALLAAIEDERRQREAAEAAAREAMMNAAPAEQPAWIMQDAPASLRAASRVESEIKDVIATLLPRVRLLHESLAVVAAEFGSRRGVYRALGELHHAREGIPPAWKKLQGLDGWLERHVANGQDDSGRIYARLNREDRAWEVLISHKSAQSRDMARLARYR